MYSAVSSSAYSAIRMRKRWLIEVVIPNDLANGSGWFLAFTGRGVGGIAGRTPGGPSRMPADPSTSPPRRRIPAWGPKRIADGGWHNLPRGKLSCARAGNLARNARALGSVRESPWESHPKPPKSCRNLAQPDCQLQVERHLDCLPGCENLVPGAERVQGVSFIPARSALSIPSFSISS